MTYDQLHAKLAGKRDRLARPSFDPTKADHFGRVKSELKLTDDPNGRATLGKSSGAPAAFTMAWLRPDLYRRVVTFNGSWINICRDGTGAAGYPDTIRATDPAKPLRLYLFSGSGDNANYPAVNQAMADAFKAKGLPWRYDFGQGATHNSTYAASRVADALLWIWAGYPL